MNDTSAKVQSGDELSELIQRAKSGDQSAYTALYEQTERELFRTIRSMVRSEDQALDIQQDSYVFAFSHLDQLEEPGKFRAWLRSIAINRTRSVLRKQSPVLFTELGSDEGRELQEQADLRPEASPELVLERKDTAECVRKIMEELSPAQRMLVGMYYYEELPISVIADTMKLSPGTVKTQLYRSRKKIEAAVRRLEAKGVKLFGLAPIPFLTALLRRQEPAAETGKALMAETLTKAGVAPAAEAVGLHVGRGFFQTALGRLALGVIAAGVVAGGVAGYRWAKSTFHIGDVRPTETFEIELRHDTEEDLTTEPTLDTEIPTTEPDTSEDLVPETSEPEETTEPADTTEPEETTEPVVAADPSGHPDAPTDPAETDPGAATQGSSLISWGNDQRTMQTGVIEFKDGAPDSYDDLFLTVRGEEVPTLYSDNEAAARVEYGNEKVRNQNGNWTYCWLVRHKGTGTANIYCRLNGVSQKIAVVNNPEHTPALIEAEWHWWGSQAQFASVRVGESARFIAQFSWCKNAELVADQPSAVSIRRVDIDQPGVWYESLYAWMVTPNSAGTFNLYLKMEGKTVGTYQLIVMEKNGADPTEPTPTDSSPTQPTPTESAPDPETP